MKETDPPETAVVEVTTVSVSLPVERSGEPLRDPAPGEPVPGSPGEVRDNAPAEPGLPPTAPVTADPVPLEPIKQTEFVVVGEPVEQPAESGWAPAVPAEPAAPAEPGLPPTEPVTSEPVRAHPRTVLVAEPAVPGEPQAENSALEPAIPGEAVVPPGEPAPSEPQPRQPRTQLVSAPHPVIPAEPGHELRKLEPMSPGQESGPFVPTTTPVIPSSPRTVLAPAEPGSSPAPNGGVVGTPAGVAPQPEGTTEAPVPSQPAQIWTKPVQPAVSQQPPGQAPVENQPQPTGYQSTPTGYQSTPGSQSLMGMPNQGGGYNFPGAQTGTGGLPPTSGDVGPDPNIQFDEGQYNQLIAVIAEIRSGARGAIEHGGVYLDAELQLQPTGQTWEPATRLVKWGSTFGGTVDTENKSLRKALSQFEDALEKAKEVFKETDDLAAYDATKFTTEYPGFNSGGASGLTGTA
ncbi:hypothetical protein ABT337_30005 [Saccharopolyspora hirsuta]|uniref:hypothetical protein n=1 Tax=Saccharopolyspora hirsuta TaxID=1837 RepID=UPI003332F629